MFPGEADAGGETAAPHVIALNPAGFAPEKLPSVTVALNSDDAPALVIKNE